MGKSDLLKDSMKSGLDGLLSSTKKSPQKKEATPLKTEKEPAVHCNFVIDKSVHTRMKFLAIEKNMSLRDIVAENELDDTATFFEVKRKAENIDMEKLEAKAAAFMRATGEFKGYSLSYKGLSMTDM